MSAELTPASVIDTVFDCINARIEGEKELLDNPDLRKDAVIRACVLAEIKEAIACSIGKLIFGRGCE